VGTFYYLSAIYFLTLKKIRELEFFLGNNVLFGYTELSVSDYTQAKTLPSATSQQL